VRAGRIDEEGFLTARTPFGTTGVSFFGDAADLGIWDFADMGRSSAATLPRGRGFFGWQDAGED
jgi:hypothetical protein